MNTFSFEGMEAEIARSCRCARAARAYLHTRWKRISISISNSSVRIIQLIVQSR